MTPLRTAIIGCGLIGRKRAFVAAAAEHSRCVAVADPLCHAASDIASATGADAYNDWRHVVDRKDIDLVIIATPNRYLSEMSRAALDAGKHVLVEKPMGRNLVEAAEMHGAAQNGHVLKVGFNHRYHPAIAEAHVRLLRGQIGDVINIRARYGHGGREGYEKEWRADREMAGGGELTDQGVHVVDLIHWFWQTPVEAFAYLQTAVWPLKDVEDNAFGLFRFKNGGVAQMHTSWTQWKNLFSFEVHGTLGSLIIDGLGGSYGPETLTMHIRRPEGGAPVTTQETFTGPDNSWELEWQDFLSAVLRGEPMRGSANDGMVAMRMLDALYRSAGTGAPVVV